MGFEMHKGTVRLGSGHSLIIGHAPQLSLLTPPTEAEIKSRVESFGLFNMATPDSVSYYKDVSAEDLVPKPDDYVRPLFRALSETIVRKTYDPIDFGHEKGVLKDSMNKLLGQTIYGNHEAYQGNEKGVVSKVMWDEGYKIGGVKVPAGFNFEAMVDGKIHTKLARELMSDPPTVHSNSVTVQFGWKQSHPKLSFDDFRGKVGTFDDRGELIRRVVNEIYLYNETSFVAHGADPFAQILDKSGKIINPGYAGSRDSFSEAKHVTTFFGFDWKDSFSEVTIPKDHKITENGDNPDNKKPRKKMKLELALMMAALAGITIPENQRTLNQEAFDEAFDEDAFTTSILEKQAELQELPTKVANLEEQIVTLTEEKTSLETFKTENEPKLALVKDIEPMKTALLAEVIRDNALITGKATTAEMKATFESADVKTLQAFKTQFGEQLDGKFPMECTSCGGHEIARASAVVGDDQDKTPKKLSLGEIKANAQKNAFKVDSSSFH
jgi:hypothetical protein